MSNLKINTEINGDNTTTTNHHENMVDISLIDEDNLAFASNSRRRGEGLISRSFSDFIVAIGFIIFGVIAMCAGMVSEFNAQAETLESVSASTAIRRVVFYLIYT